jgi:NADH dehydrogenase (ubiquinone) 1 beta subcomplex subunit 9
VPHYSRHFAPDHPPRSLYRRALKTSLDWAVHRDVWRGQALYIRRLFEAQRDVKDFKSQRVRRRVLAHRVADAAQALVEETEHILQTWKHPEPYIPPTAPGGTKFERNLPPPILNRWSRNSRRLSVLTFCSTSTNGCMITLSWGLQWLDSR